MDWKIQLINSIAFNGGWVSDNTTGFYTATVIVSHRLGTRTERAFLNVDILYYAPWDDTEAIKG